MRYANDPKRAAILQDLLLNYETRGRRADNAPPMPPGVADDEEAERQFYERWEMNPMSQEFMPEGQYPNAEDGRPDAMMVPEAPFDDDMRAYMHEQMPSTDDKVIPMSPPPGGGRQRLLADRLRRG